MPHKSGICVLMTVMVQPSNMLTHWQAFAKDHCLYNFNCTNVMFMCNINNGAGRLHAGPNSCAASCPCAVLYMPHGRKASKQKSETLCFCAPRSERQVLAHQGAAQWLQAESAAAGDQHSGTWSSSLSMMLLTETSAWCHHSMQAALHVIKVWFAVMLAFFFTSAMIRSGQAVWHWC